MQSLLYDSDDLFQRSPGLVPVRPKATPSPSPPPIVQQVTISTQNVSSPSSRRRRKPNRRPKTRPSQGDTVLIGFMAPNRPDIARQVGERALNSDSGSEADADDEEEMEGPSPVEEAAPHATPHATTNQLAQTDSQKANLQATAGAALSIVPKAPVTEHRDSVVEDQVDDSSRGNVGVGLTSPHTTVGSLANGVHKDADGVGSKSPASVPPALSATSPRLTGERAGSLADGNPHGDSTTSHNLRELAIPPGRGSPSQKLPAIQSASSPLRDGPAGSPIQERLPSFRQMADIADTATNEQAANGFSHRQSVSSTGQSPTLITRQLSISSQRSPGGAYAASPAGDIFLRSGQNLSLFGPRRPSQASETNPPYSLPSASTTNDSSDGLSPGTQVTSIEHRASIDSTLSSRTLPLPNGSLALNIIPHHGSGGFKCDHPGCNAPPFQTQYLLNSHANVHSQSRPHYCTVPGCPRGEGGKGFKRKNEMIRHGLVHASPGYVCPFCPDREHKYPRPDNLQRHVRVHHVDKDKDDPQLRDVLAQRPEGGSRGRRRRVGSG